MDIEKPNAEEELEVASQTLVRLEIIQNLNFALRYFKSRLLEIGL